MKTDLLQTKLPDFDGMPDFGCVAIQNGRDLMNAEPLPFAFPIVPTFDWVNVRNNGPIR